MSTFEAIFYYLLFISLASILDSHFHYILVPCRGRKCSHHAECVARGNQGICQCPRKCPDNLKPRRICASDGNTFNNECELKRASCLQQKPLQVKHKGTCGRCLFIRDFDFLLFLPMFFLSTFHHFFPHLSCLPLFPFSSFNLFFPFFFLVFHLCFSIYQLFLHFLLYSFILLVLSFFPACYSSFLPSIFLSSIFLSSILLSLPLIPSL